jgi:hypothetical protein
MRHSLDGGGIRRWDIEAGVATFVDVRAMPVIRPILPAVPVISVKGVFKLVASLFPAVAGERGTVDSQMFVSIPMRSTSEQFAGNASLIPAYRTPFATFFKGKGSYLARVNWDDDGIPATMRKGWVSFLSPAYSFRLVLVHLVHGSMRVALHGIGAVLGELGVEPSMNGGDQIRIVG